MAVAKAKTSLATGESIAKVIALTSKNELYEASMKEIGQAVASETELHGNAWGVVIDQSKDDTKLEAVGNWSLWTTYRAGIGRYMVNPMGKSAKLNPLNSAQYLNGSVIDVAKGNVCTIADGLYCRVVDDPKTGKTTIWASTNNIGGFYIPRQVIGCYFAHEASGKLWSRPSVVATRSKTISAFHSSAQVVSKSWGLCDYRGRQLLTLLYLFEYKDRNSQKVLGNGLTGTGDNFEKVKDLPTGATASLGDACGSIPYTGNSSLPGACHISLFGVENPYGLYWEMLQGIYYGKKDNAAQDGTEVFIYEGNRLPSTGELETQPKGRFRKLKRPITSGFISSLKLGENFDLIPTALVGTATTKWCDQSFNNDTGQLALFGASASNGSQSGLVSSHSANAFGVAGSLVAARLAFYGDVTFVDPAEL